MMKRRAKIKVQPVFTAAAPRTPVAVDLPIEADGGFQQSSVSSNVENDLLQNVKPLQQSRDVHFDDPTIADISSDDIITEYSLLRSGEIVELQELKKVSFSPTFDSVQTPITLVQTPTAPVQTPTTPVQTPTTPVHETISRNQRTQSPEIDEIIDIPIIFGNRNDTYGSNSPASFQTPERSKENGGDKPVAVGNKNNLSRSSSPASSVPHKIPKPSKKRAAPKDVPTQNPNKKDVAERLADRLVAKRVKERQKNRCTGTLDEPVNKSSMRMMDLIYLNPQTSPMRQDSPPKEKVVLKEATRDEPQIIEDAVEEESLPVPQLEIGPDGRIVVNQASLVINQKLPNYEEMEVVDFTNYQFDGYPKKARSRRWGVKETKRFYAALSMVGTDFLLISKLIPNRSRDDVKKKFKREDKVNRMLIDMALKEKRPMDITLLAEPLSDEDLTDEKPAKKRKVDSQKENNAQEKETKKKAKTPRKPKRKARTFYESSGESTAEQPKKSVAKKDVKKRKIIDDDEPSSVCEENVATENADPYEFDGDTEVEDDIEITEYIQRRRAGPRRTCRVEEDSERCSPADVADSSSVQDKLNQQLEQMEMDQRRSTLKTGTEIFDADSVQYSEEGDSVAGCQKLFNQLPTNGKSRAVINVIDHRSVNLEELGIGEIPPNHKLVVVSTPLTDNGFPQQSDNDEDQQLLQVFTISESALKTMMEDANNSSFDPVAMLLAMAQGENPLASGSDPEGVAPGASPERCGPLSPPVVQNEPFVDDVKQGLNGEDTAETDRTADD